MVTIQQILAVYLTICTVLMLAGIGAVVTFRLVELFVEWMSRASR